MHPWFRAHAARAGDPLTARAAVRTASRAGADDVLTLLALAADDPSALAPLPPAAPAPTPESPEVVELGDSALARVDHGVSSTVLFGGTDTAALGRVTSGSSSQSTVARFLGTTLGIRELRLSRDFFSLGPLRPGPPRRLADDAEKRHRYSLQERIAAEYFHPLRAPDLDPAGDYALEFNGRFAAAMDFSHRPADLVSLSTSMTASLGPGSLDLHWEFEGPGLRSACCSLWTAETSSRTGTTHRCTATSGAGTSWTLGPEELRRRPSRTAAPRPPASWSAPGSASTSAHREHSAGGRSTTPGRPTRSSAPAMSRAGRCS